MRAHRRLLIHPVKCGSAVSREGERP
jgi:hypothetical protein